MVETGLPPMGSFSDALWKEVSNRSSYALSQRRRKLCSLVDKEAPMEYQKKQSVRNRFYLICLEEVMLCGEIEQVVWDISRESSQLKNELPKTGVIISSNESSSPDQLFFSLFLMKKVFRNII
ncbi:hypothetical protein CEXT_478001 [Caerostris extrusa]|uniref:Uncharacterized protein n=1 Tax=Caerostris extrusa TaxID=172846 RepID=A0AAV4TKV0_CAEEX|nr:hypothetical protein CEXT_478001 [Caerostris extrusa]